MARRPDGRTNDLEGDCEGAWYIVLRPVVRRRQSDAGQEGPVRWSLFHLKSALARATLSPSHEPHQSRPGLLMAEIFISWSKDRSLSFAKALRQLMGKVLHDPAPDGVVGSGEHLIALSQDLPKGGNWFQNLAGLLENARAGIVCVTPENRSSPWLLFESGALIRCDIKVALFPVLLDLPAAVEGPLGLVQGTIIERDPAAIKRETLELLRRVTDHINDSRSEHKIYLDEPGSADPGPSVSDPWDVFTTEVVKIQPASVISIFDRFAQLFERKTFQEPFEDCADQRWLDRYVGARLARDEMERHKELIGAALPTGAQLAYDHLSAAVDSYAMAIAGLLLEQREFGREHDGRLTDAEGRLAVCERRRQAIVTAYMRLRDPVPPVFDDARIYEELSDLEERKIRLIHPLEQRLEAQRAEPTDNNAAVVQAWQLQRAAISPWLDHRLVFYVHAARAEDHPPFEDLLQGLERELSLVEARDEPATLVGLYYALEAIDKRDAGQVDRTRFHELLDRIDARIEEWNRPPDRYAFCSRPSRCQPQDQTESATPPRRSMIAKAVAH